MQRCYCIKMNDWMILFGFPLVPEVNSTKAESSDVISTFGASLTYLSLATVFTRTRKIALLSPKV